MSPDTNSLKISQMAALKAINALPLQQRMALLLSAENDDLAAAEAAKTHPITPAKFSTQELAGLKAYLLDGGGVRDDQQLCLGFVNALLDEDWPTVLQELPHIVKCWLKSKGIVVPTQPGQGVILNGAGPSAPLTTSTTPLTPELIAAANLQ